MRTAIRYQGNKPKITAEVIAEPSKKGAIGSGQRGRSIGQNLLMWPPIELYPFWEQAYNHTMSPETRP